MLKYKRIEDLITMSLSDVSSTLHNSLYNYLYSFLYHYMTQFKKIVHL